MILKFINQGEYKKAKNNLLVIIKKDEGDAEAYNLLGYTERQLQNYISAIKFYKKAIFINNDFIGAHHYIAMAYLELDDIEKAKYHLNQLDLICLFGCKDYFEVKNRSTNAVKLISPKITNTSHRLISLREKMKWTAKKFYIEELKFIKE